LAGGWHRIRAVPPAAPWNRAADEVIDNGDASSLH
jgi:hypothetical protein